MATLADTTKKRPEDDLDRDVYQRAAGIVATPPPDQHNPYGGPWTRPAPEGPTGAPRPTPTDPVPTDPNKPVPIDPGPVARPAPGGKVYHGVDPSRTFTAADARKHIESLIGRSLTDPELQEAIAISGWNGTGSLTGEQLNKVIQEAAKRTGAEYGIFQPPVPIDPGPRVFEVPDQPGGPKAPGGPTAPGVPGGGGGLDNALMERLMEFMGPVNPNLDDPLMRQRMDLFRAKTQRGAERQRASAAERAAAGGTLGSGGFDRTIAQIEADRGLSEAEHGAGLLSREIDALREQQMQGMRMASGLYDSAMGRALQRELGLGDLDVRRRGLDLQGELGRGDLDLRKYLGRGQLGLGLLASLLGDRQFRDRLGFDYATLQDLMNRAAVNRIFD